eukprot:TRINITY_DN11661_c0_g1_i1.p1 TRINITY_DN11661_c0_g1~~TRINITY_DN11661_c0_g1_i1.p1  ORF type:complete len:309 (+),score=39.26 TRINITY_DN11661_c0_g1_i1:30-956(+)
MSSVHADQAVLDEEQESGSYTEFSSMSGVQPLEVVGRTVAVASVTSAIPQDIQLVGPFFNPQIRDSLLSGHAWSDGMCSCSNDCSLCCMSMWCPCFVNYQVLERIGHVFAGPVGLVSKDLYAKIFVGLLVLLVLPYGAWMSGIISIAFYVLLWSGVRNKLQVAEGDLTTCLKTCCCSSCYLAQIARHANRMQGFSTMGEGDIILQPLVGHAVVLHPPTTAAVVMQQNTNDAAQTTRSADVQPIAPIVVETATAHETQAADEAAQETEPKAMLSHATEEQALNGYQHEHEVDRAESLAEDAEDLRGDAL